ARALASFGLLVEARKGGVLPARDPSQLTLEQARAAARATLRHPAHHLDRVGNALAQAWERADEAVAAALGETVAQLLARTEREASRQAPSPAGALALSTGGERSRP